MEKKVQDQEMTESFKQGSVVDIAKELKDNRMEDKQTLPPLGEQESFTSEVKYSEGIIQKRNFIERFALGFKSSEFAFIVALMGVIGQGFHIYHVVHLISDLTYYANIVNSLVWAIFFSFGVMFFTLKLGTAGFKHQNLKKKFMRTLNWLIAFEIVVNLYYWTNRLVIGPGFLGNPEYFDVDGNIIWSLVDWTKFNIQRIEWPRMLIAIVFSVAIPLNQKAYAGEILFRRNK